jgi:hypothetical protein
VIFSIILVHQWYSVLFSRTPRCIYRTRDLWVCGQEPWPLDHRGCHHLHHQGEKIIDRNMLFNCFMSSLEFCKRLILRSGIQGSHTKALNVHTCWRRVLLQLRLDLTVQKGGRVYFLGRVRVCMITSHRILPTVRTACHERSFWEYPMRFGNLRWYLTSYQPPAWLLWAVTEHAIEERCSINQNS